MVIHIDLLPLQGGSLVKLTHSERTCAVCAVIDSSFFLACIVAAE